MRQTQILCLLPINVGASLLAMLLAI